MNRDSISRILTIIIWIASVVLWILKGWWYLAAVIFILHFAETIILGIRTGRENGRTVFFSIIMTMIFGVTWWGPLRRKV